MIDQQFEREADSRSAVVRCLANGDRRRIFTLLRGRESPTRVDDLAIRLAVRAAGEPPHTPTVEEHRRQLTRLRHEHLPAMANAGLVVHDGGAGTVVAVEHPVVDDLEIDVLCSAPEVSDEDVDARLRALANARRRTALAALAERRNPAAVRSLARDVVARETGAAREDVPETDVDRAHVSLVHSHLPALQEAGLVEYDAEAGYASADGRRAIRACRSAASDVRSEPSRPTPPS